MELLVPFDSEVRKRAVPQNDANFGIGALVWSRCNALRKNRQSRPPDQKAPRSGYLLLRRSGGADRRMAPIARWVERSRPASQEQTERGVFQRARRGRERRRLARGLEHVAFAASGWWV